MGHSTLVATTKAGRPASSRVIDTLLGFERKVATDEEGTARQITTTVGDGHVNATTAGGQKRPSVPKLELTTALQPQPPSSAAPVSNSPRKMVSMRLEGDEAWAAQGPKSLNRWASLLSTVLPDGGEAGVDVQQRRGQQAAALSLPSPCNLLDRQTFRTLGIPDVIVSRVYKLLEAYVVGFNGLVRDILSGQPEGRSPELAAVVWQSLLGMAEEHFKAGYRSEMGAITQRLVEQQSDLHGQLQQAEKTIAAMEGQNGVMQSAMHLVRSELQQEIDAKQYAQRLRNVADRKAEESRVEAARAQTDARSMSAAAENLALLPGKVLGLRYQLRQLQNVEVEKQNVEAAMHAMSVEKTATEDALDSARRATEVERVGRADAERLIKHCQDHCEELQTHMKENQETIRALQASNAEALANVRSVEEVAKIDRAARSSAEASLQTEKNAHAKTHEKLLDQLKQLAAAEDRVQELRGVEMDLKQQLGEQSKRLKTATNASRFRLSATEARLRTQEVDKAVSVEAVTRELEDMARWKEQWRHKYKEAEERIERMKGEAWEKAQDHKEALRSLREQLRAEYVAETQQMHNKLLAMLTAVRLKMAQHDAEVTALVSDYTAKLEERDGSIIALKAKFAKKNAALLKELTSGQMMRQKVEREAEATARELKAAQDMLYMVNERAEREQAGHSAELARARNAENEAKTDLNMIKMDMEQLEAELGRKSDTICEMLEGVEASRLRAIRAEEIATQLRAQLSETTARLESNLKSWQASHSKMETSLKESEADRKELKKKLWAMENKVEEAERGRESALRQLRDVAEASEARARQLEEQASQAAVTSQEASKDELGVQDSAFEMQVAHKELEARLKAELREATEQMESYREQLDEVLEREYELKRSFEEQEEAREHLYSQLLEAKLESERSAEELAEAKGRRAVAAATESSETKNMIKPPAAKQPSTLVEKVDAPERNLRESQPKAKSRSAEGGGGGGDEEGEAEGERGGGGEWEVRLLRSLDQSAVSPRGGPGPSHAEQTRRDAALVAALSQQDAERYRVQAEAAKRRGAGTGGGGGRTAQRVSRVADATQTNASLHSAKLGHHHRHHHH